jgi:hypothetical protein
LCTCRAWFTSQTGHVQAAPCTPHAPPNSKPAAEQPPEYPAVQP